MAAEWFLNATEPKKPRKLSLHLLRVLYVSGCGKMWQDISCTRSNVKCTNALIYGYYTNGKINKYSLSMRRI